MVMNDAQALAVLARNDAAQHEVMAALAALDRSETPRRALRLGIAANVTVDLLAVYLRRHAYLAGVRLSVAKGSYDDLIGDVRSHAGVDLLLVLPFFDNLQPSWEAQLGAWRPDATGAPGDAVQADYLGRLALALQDASGVGQVLLLGAHLWNPDVPPDGAPHTALAAFNAGLAEVAARHANVRLIDLAGLLARFGSARAFDARFYFRAKSPYTPLFLDAIAGRAAQVTRGFGSVFHKVLVLDCDHTLWGGIVGEDGIEGIQLDRHGFPGNVYWTVQQQFKALEAQGALLCLCSKNNPADVDEVLAQHPDMVLKAAHLVARKVNWDDKPANLRALAAELNLGLDSFVFVDDSAFELEAVRQQLPEVRVFQVPTSLHDYPSLVRDQIAPLFSAGATSGASRGKTGQYKALAEAAQARSGFANQDDYLRSLGLAVTLQRDARSELARITELIAKSNQFNLTTERLQAGDVAALMERADATVYSFSVADRLAEHGLTGVLVTEDVGEAVVVRSFLMSCRVIGRGVEFAVWRALQADALARGRRLLKAYYRASARNAQVQDFYDRLGLTLLEEAEDGSRSYESPLATVRLADSPWVELRHA